jgi:hypothetical protein
MELEALSKPIRFHFADGETVRLEPGRPVNLPTEKAEKVLEKAKGKVRVISPTAEVQASMPHTEAPQHAFDVGGDPTQRSIPKFSSGQRVLLKHNTHMTTGTIVEVPWWQEERPYLYGWWYTVETTDRHYTLIHESRLIDVGIAKTG